MAAAVVLAAAATAAAAWFSAPNPADLSVRVRDAAVAHGADPVVLSDVAPLMREAVVATEDERFYRHHGVDLIGVARALAYDVTHLTTSQGASTITEQLAKDLYLGGDDHSVWRKLEAAVIALRIETANTKERILADYLNTVYFGDGAYGIGAASQRYFGVPPGRLSLDQASVLAGLIQAPAAYDPFVDPAAARDRQVSVLASMARNGFITREEASAALARPLGLTHGPAIPADPGVSIPSGPLVAVPELILAGALVAGSLVVIATRRRVASPIPRIAGWASIVGALFLFARAFRVD